jgi:Sodium/calcium exchanger protein
VLSEGLLGVIAALAADAPEVTSAVTALAYHQQRVGAGVVIGSNVFNLAALPGLGAVAVGRIALHRKVVILGGVVSTWIAVACVLVVLGLLTPVARIAVVAVVLCRTSSSSGWTESRCPGCRGGWPPGTRALLCSRWQLPTVTGACAGTRARSSSRLPRLPRSLLAAAYAVLPGPGAVIAPAAAAAAARLLGLALSRPAQ